MTADMELLYPVVFLLLTGTGVTSGDKNGRVVVDEGSHVVLPCSPGQTDLTNQVFEWKKDGQELFYYDVNTGGGRGGQDPQFKGRLSYFDYDLDSGNASIKIRHTKVEDSGNYSCEFPRLQNQKFHIELIVDQVLKKRDIEGAAPEPSVTVHDHEATWVQLQCSVREAFPYPRVQWKNSSGHVIPSVMTLESEVNTLFDIDLRAYVVQTGYYSCVVTQDEIHHQVFTKTFMLFSADLPPEKTYGGMTTGVLIGLAVGILATLAVVGIVFVIRRKRSASVI